MKISELKTGFTLLQKPKFVLKDASTWMGPCILFFINIWNIVYKKHLCDYTHCMTVILIGTDLFIFEAIESGYKRTLLSEKIKEVGLDRLLILVPKFNYDESISREAALKLENLKYNFKGLTLDEGVFQLTDERLWIGNRNINKRTFCSEADAYIKYKATNGELFPNYYEVSPNDLFQSNLFTHENLEL
jgi:hypothetical protein